MKLIVKHFQSTCQIPLDYEFHCRCHWQLVYVGSFVVWHVFLIRISLYQSHKFHNLTVTASWLWILYFQHGSDMEQLGWERQGSSTFCKLLHLYTGHYNQHKLFKISQVSDMFNHRKSFSLLLFHYLLQPYDHWKLTNKWPRNKICSMDCIQNVYQFHKLGNWEEFCRFCLNYGSHFGQSQLMLNSWNSGHRCDAWEKSSTFF